jgi:pimeloyl-ACP methyl ester carboxylesterase
MRTGMVDVAGRPVHVADCGGEGPAVVLLHGLGGSHLNWTLLGPLLARRARVWAPDLAGFGKTPPAGRSTSVVANARLAHSFVREVVGGPALLVGNSMGGLVSLILASAAPNDVAGLVLIDPAIPIAPRVRRDRQVTLAFSAYMVPGIGELFVRRRAAVLGPEGLVRETFRMCCVDPSRVPDDVVEAHVEMVRARTEMPWANASVLRAARSLMGLIIRRRRFGRMVERIEAPAILIQGEADRFVTAAAARLVAKERPDWTLRVLDDLGHTPHLEDPQRTAGEIWRWLDGPGAEALEGAHRVARTPQAATGG